MNSDHARSHGRDRVSSLAVSLISLLVSTALAVQPAFAQAIFGTLSNFDVFNDTGQETHGFEIELDGITSADVTYTFGGTYIRYGTPRVTDFAGGVYVRYESPWDPVHGVFTQATPLAPAVITPTAGHACWSGGSGNYLTAGCEHFGVALARNPTNTVYRWLGADPVTPGNLIALGTKVSIPAPTWNVVPQPAAPPIVQAVIPAEAPEPGQQFGDAKWVKVYVTESPSVVQLHHLVTDDPGVPQDAAEVETEWVLLQDGPGAVNELLSEAPAGAASESVTRRYEFYKYTGAYDAESHEALPAPFVGTDPAPGDLGNYIGAQIAAVNLAAAPLAVEPSPLPTGEHGVPYNTALVTGGTPPYTITTTKGTFPTGLTADATTGNLSGIPDVIGKTYMFTLSVTDSGGASITARTKLTILRSVEITSHRLPTARVGRNYKGSLRATSGQRPYTWTLIAGTMPANLTYDPATGAITGVPLSPGTTVLTFQVTGSLGGTSQDDVTLTIR